MTQLEKSVGSLLQTLAQEALTRENVSAMRKELQARVDPLEPDLENTLKKELVQILIKARCKDTTKDH